MPHLANLTPRTHQSLLRKQVTRLHTQLTSHHILIQTIIARDTHMTQMSLRSLSYTHLQIHTIPHDISLSRIQTIKDITIIVIQIAHSIIIRSQTLLHTLLVVNIPPIHVKHLLQILTPIHRVAHPFDIANIIPTSLLHMNSNIHMLLIHRNHTIRNDQRIAITQLTIVSQQVVLRLLIVRLDKLMLLKPVTHSPPLMNRSQHTLTDERPLEFSILNDRITLHPYLTYDNLAILPNIDRHDHLVRRSRIILLQDLNLSVLVALLIKIPLSQNLCAIDHIRRQLIILDQPQLRLQILPITLLHPSITHLRDTRARHEFDTQISRIIHNRIHPHRHV